MCKYIKPVDTKTKFIILMHPKEFKKTKNGTGHFTKLSIKDSELYIGIDFTNHNRINNILNDTNNNCYILYPSNDSIKLNKQSIDQANKKNVVFIIDSTWACSKKILRVSKNITNLQKISFEHQKSSQFKIKTQPNEYCLSTIESTLCVLELLENKKYNNFLLPFEKMVEYQLNCSKNNGVIRYKENFKKGLKKDA